MEAAPEESSGQTATAPAPSVQPWTTLKDDELLGLRLCDLGLRIEGSELEPYISNSTPNSPRAASPPSRLLSGRRMVFPAGVPAIAIPFYLAHPRLKSLELHQMMEVEGGTPEWCMMLLRHECGHAVDHAWQFSRRKEWQRIFGSPETKYTPETYTPRPYSRGFVRHLPNWYAQAHPDEDFAETFAVWLSSPIEELRERYRGLEGAGKIEYVDALMREVSREAATTKPVVRRGRRMSEASRLRKTLARHYAARRKLYAEDFPDFYDADLRAIFLEGRTRPGLRCPRHAPPPRRAHRRHRAMDRPAEIHCRYAGPQTHAALPGTRLQSPRDPVTLHMELAAYLSALVTNHLYTGRFKTIRLRAVMRVLLLFDVARPVAPDVAYTAEISFRKTRPPKPTCSPV